MWVILTESNLILAESCPEKVSLSPSHNSYNHKGITFPALTGARRNDKVSERSQGVVSPHTPTHYREKVKIGISENPHVNLLWVSLFAIFQSYHINYTFEEHITNKFLCFPIFTVALLLIYLWSVAAHTGNTLAHFVFVSAILTLFQAHILLISLLHSKHPVVFIPSNTYFQVWK